MDDPKTEKPEDRRARLLKRDAERVEAERARAENLKLDELELVEKLEAELGEPRGQAFQTMRSDAANAVIAVRRKEAVLYTRYMGTKMEDADNFEFVSQCVCSPDLETFKRIAAQFPGVVLILSNLLAKLYGLQAETNQGK